MLATDLNQNIVIEDLSNNFDNLRVQNRGTAVVSYQNFKHTIQAELDSEIFKLTILIWFLMKPLIKISTTGYHNLDISSSHLKVQD